MLFRHLLDLDAALFADHQDDALGGAIDDEAEIELLVDGQALFDQQARDPLAGRARLIGDERLTDQLARDLFGFVERLGELDAAGLATPAGVNLRLDHGDRGAEPLGDLGNFLRRKGHFTARHWNAVLGKNRLGLILVNLHKKTSLS